MSRTRVLSGLLVVALSIACGLVVMLAGQQTTLRREYAELRRQANDLHSGSVVPPFRGATLEGDSLTIGEAPDSLGRQLLFVFTTTCRYCEATLPTWARLADSARRLPPWRIQVVGISLDSVEQSRRYVEAHGISYPIVQFPNRKYQRLYRANRVPETVVVDSEGNVIFARLGVLSDPLVLDSVYRALALLPRRRSAASGITAREP